MSSGPSSEEKEAYTAQTQFTQQLESEYSTVFGEDQTIYNNLVSTFEPILQAGASQTGFSTAELNSLNSQAITGTAKSYQQAEQALQTNQASQGGGTAYMPSGAQTQEKEMLASSAASSESSQLQQIEQADYQQGYNNWLEAANMLGESSSVANSSLSGSSSVNQSLSNEESTASQITKDQNSWLSSVGGILGSTVSSLGGI